jgi:hypothetical protein
MLPLVSTRQKVPSGDCAMRADDVLAARLTQKREPLSLAYWYGLPSVAIAHGVAAPAAIVVNDSGTDGGFVSHTKSAESAGSASGLMRCQFCPAFEIEQFTRMRLAPDCAPSPRTSRHFPSGR